MLILFQGFVNWFIVMYTYVVTSAHIQDAD